MLNFTRAFKLAATSALVATLSLAFVAPATADDRRGRDRGERNGHDRGHYDRHDRDRHSNQRNWHDRSHYKSPKIVVRPSVGFSYYQSYPSYYRPHYTSPRLHRYNGWAYNRPSRRHHSGFGFYYSDNDAFRFLGLTALSLIIVNELSESHQRAHEDALARATTARVGDRITWNQNGYNGNVVVTREGQTTDGRPCREFQQEVIIGGNREQAYGTACMQPDGAWKVLN